MLGFLRAASQTLVIKLLRSSALIGWVAHTCCTWMGKKRGYWGTLKRNTNNTQNFHDESCVTELNRCLGNWS